MVVGAGYAGQAAAVSLARAGRGSRVLVVDRRGRSGYPPSSTSGIASYWLEQLGFPPTPDAVSSPIRSFRLVVSGDPPGTERVLSAGNPLAPELGVVLQEANFLGRIEAEAARAGVAFWHATHAEDARRKGDVYEVDLRETHGRHAVTASWVLDAGGYDSRISRRLGITRALPDEDRHNGLEVSVPNTGQHPPDRVTLYLGDWAPSGYAWVFPSSEDGVAHLRVGIGTPLSVRDARGVPVPVRKYFDGFLRDFPEFHLPAHHRMGGVIPTYRPDRKLHRGRVLSLGDAGRMCDPLTGGGIHQALASGVAAALAVAADDPDGYERGLAPFIREMRLRYRWKQVLLGMTTDEVRATMDALVEIRLPPGRFSPYAMRREALRHLRARGLRPLRILWRSNRLWKAVAG
ncbi:MAG: NAD(P)/FAD-dependent oxidoreductase [Acidimicrobiales bacterium]|nr:NAD(P)/FAD-dependent oxidoreductase [Acidimicrobiales bacterium]